MLAGAWEAAHTPAAQAEGRWFHGAADLADAFYQFRCEDLGEDFGLNWPAPARTYGCNEVYENGAFDPIRPDDFVFPVSVGIPMGWSWALWAVHTTVSHWVGLTSDLSPDPLMLEDKRVAPPAHSDAAVAAVYVDNRIIFGADLACVERRFRRVLRAFEALGLRLHEIEEPCAGAGPFEVVGLVVDAAEGTVRPKTARAWRLHRGLLGLASRRSLCGWQLRIALGHIVSYAQLAPLALAVLQHSYVFVFKFLNVRAPLWDSPFGAPCVGAPRVLGRGELAGAAGWPRLLWGRLDF